jgi:DNA modification methylase
MSEMRVREIKWMKAGEVQPNPKNWREHPPHQRAALRGVLEEIGFAGVLMAFEKDGILTAVDGHLRIEEEPDLVVPVAVLDIDETEADKLLATYDPLGAMAQTGKDALVDLLGKTQFESSDVSAMLESLANDGYQALAPLLDLTQPKTDPEADETTTEELTSQIMLESYEPITKVGDIWQLGRHRIICADIFDDETVGKLLQGKTVDAVWTDPPYAIYGSASGISSSVADDKLVRPFFRDVLKLGERYAKLFAHMYICCDWRSWPSWWEVAKPLHVEPKNLLIWQKDGGLGFSYANYYECVGFFSHIEETKTMSSHKDKGVRGAFAPNIVKLGRVPQSTRQHNAAKPVELIEYCLRNAVDEGESVADWFLGSGSTLIACESMNLTCYGSEIDPKYIDIIVGRWETYTGQKAKRIRSGAEENNQAEPGEKETI